MHGLKGSRRGEQDQRREGAKSKLSVKWTAPSWGKEDKVAEYLEKAVTKSQVLEQGQSMTVQFEPDRAGTITLTGMHGAMAMYPLLSVTLAVLNPDSVAPVAQYEHNKFGLASLQYNLSAAGVAPGKKWTARLTNTGTLKISHSLTATYLTNTILKTAQVPASYLEMFVNGVLSKTQIHLSDGQDASYIRFPDSLGGQQYRFTVPRFKKKINMPWPIPDIRVEERVEDVNSEQMTLEVVNAGQTHANGSLRLHVTLEEGGTEIRGTFHVQLRNMKLAISLGLEAQEGKISYTTHNIIVQFTCDTDISNVPAWLESYVLDPLFGYTQAIREAVVGAVRAFLSQEAARAAFADALTQQLSSLLGNHPVVTSVRVENDKVTLKYYNA
jgi:hypothetical protein